MVVAAGAGPFYPPHGRQRVRQVGEAPVPFVQPRYADHVRQRPRKGVFETHQDVTPMDLTPRPLQFPP